KHGVAEGLYRRLGYQEVGVIPGYARTVTGALVTEAFFYRTLDDERRTPGSPVAGVLAAE
ncbi:MAG TPA: hypothetical protein VGP82_24030, partial [Ktedonobacterales bacterium]|nr:hypothetical protein [Ktedonobacterales bacterium]